MDSTVVARLVYSMIQFLKSQLETTGASSLLSEEGAESVEVAVQCLETAYGISQESSHLASSRPLYDIFREATKDEVTRGIYPNLNAEPTPEDKEEAERLKNDGNQQMREERFDKALELYTKAIAKDSLNSVYYCNRAAAHSKLNNHLEAIEDCRRALQIEPNYGKAYGRMGLAYSALDKAMEAKDCYQKALELEPDNESYRGNLQIAESKLRSQSQTTSSTVPPNPFAAFTSGGAGLQLGPFGNFPGLSSGGGGLPDLQTLINNPALMNMATQLMSDPTMQNVVSNIFSNFGVPVPQRPSSGGGINSNSSGGSAVESENTTPSDAVPPQQGMEAIIHAGRQFAEQMQSQYPDLVEQLRSQMNNRTGGSGPNQNGEGDQQDPPQPPPPQS
ncbi:UNVERIFIED_CONTAM: hypothetical protein RMT77_015441 [Armadillidium vulgare]|nr:Small glutamine-rich tetratricopeptide repeat-containing protein alpha [Armadillidium vulgare]